MIGLIPTRVELIHPILVHFPIALIVSATFARIISIFLKDGKWFLYLRAIYFWSLSLGVLGLVGAYFSGEEAEDIVNRIICDPTITHDHAELAELTLIAAGVSLILSVSYFLLSKRFNLKTSEAFQSLSFQHKTILKLNLVLELLALTSLVGLLVQTAHLGGTLVYEQGAGYLRIPNENCVDTESSLDTPPEDD